MTNYKISADAQRKLHVCIQAERKEKMTMIITDKNNKKHVMASKRLFACVCQNFLSSCELFQYVSIIIFFLYIKYVSDVGIDVILKKQAPDCK
jgi:hypothetical protein